VQFQCTDPWDDRLPSQVETTLYRVMQEALTNVAKHSGAGRVSLILNRHAGDVQIIVEDDGVGFDAEGATDSARPQRRLGLIGMKERVQAVGGVFQVESVREGGTTLFVRIPLRGENARPSDG
jgi:signal transduction histidine kinase